MLASSCRSRQRIENEHALSDQLDFETSESRDASKAEPQVQNNHPKTKKKKKKINSQLKSKVLIVAFRISNYFVGQIT